MLGMKTRCIVPFALTKQAICWYFPDRTPEAFGKFLQSSIDWMDQNPDRTTKERIVLVYAWNEFGEGGYLAPTKGDPEAKYLRALKEVVFPMGVKR